MSYITCTKCGSSKWEKLDIQQIPDSAGVDVPGYNIVWNRPGVEKAMLTGTPVEGAACVVETWSLYVCNGCGFPREKR